MIKPIDKLAFKNAAGKLSLDPIEIFPSEEEASPIVIHPEDCLSLFPSSYSDLCGKIENLRNILRKIGGTLLGDGDKILSGLDRAIDLADGEESDWSSLTGGIKGILGDILRSVSLDRNPLEGCIELNLSNPFSGIFDEIKDIFKFVGGKLFQVLFPIIDLAKTFLVDFLGGILSKTFDILKKIAGEAFLGLEALISLSGICESIMNSTNPDSPFYEVEPPIIDYVEASDYGILV